MEGFLDGYRNSFLIPGQPEMGILYVCMIARESERERRENSGFLL